MTHKENGALTFRVLGPGHGRTTAGRSQTDSCLRRDPAEQPASIQAAQGDE
jgi:hypothetical protein